MLIENSNLTLSLRRSAFALRDSNRNEQETVKVLIIMLIFHFFILDSTAALHKLQFKTIQM